MISNLLKLFLLSSLLLLNGCGGGSSKKNDEHSATNNSESSNSTHINLSIKGDTTIECSLGATQEECDPGATASDENGKNLTEKIRTDFAVDTTKVGSYTITYSIESNQTKRKVIIPPYNPLSDIAPYDTNIHYAKEKGVLYYADPRTEEHGENRAIKIDYNKMKVAKELPLEGINPHSIDRAGKTDKFYIRTQNSTSFGVVNFEANESSKQVDLGEHKPRAIGGYNQKYNIQLLAVKNRPVIDVIDVEKDELIYTAGSEEGLDTDYDKSVITSNAGSGSATGHGLWFDENHFGLIDRVHRQILVYKVEKKEGKLTFERTDTPLIFSVALHAIERVNNPQTVKDLTTFYALAEGDVTKKTRNEQAPFVYELTFDPEEGTLRRAKDTEGKQTRLTLLTDSIKAINGIKPTTHHLGISPDGQYLVVPVYDEKVYIINRSTMKIEKTLEAKLGAAHVEFSTELNLAIITNHFDQHITIIDMKELKVKKQLKISDHTFNPQEPHLLQPHFSYVSEDGLYFYTFATQDGDFLKINLKTLEIEETLHTGGAPEQAHSKAI